MFYWRVLPNWLKFIRKVKHGNLSSVNSNKWVILTFDLYFHTPTIIKKFPWCVEFEMVIMYDTCNFAMYWKQFAEKMTQRREGWDFLDAVDEWWFQIPEIAIASALQACSLCGAVIKLLSAELYSQERRSVVPFWKLAR